MSQANRPRMRVSSVVLGAPEPSALAAFYHRLLGWTVVEEYPARPGYPAQDGWAMLRPPSDSTGLRGLSVQWEPNYLAPVWPPVGGEQQMMVHLDIAVEDLEAGVDWALQAGASVAEHQPQEHVRVMIDPAGHPFCLVRGPVD
jgi:catechol 2,3-dioxygenase-like lactoylglutathione lyase family enzyme